MKLYPLSGYLHADPAAASAPSAAPAAPASADPAPSEDVVDVDWGTVVNELPASDDDHQEPSGTPPSSEPPASPPVASGSPPPPPTANPPAAPAPAPAAPPPAPPAAAAPPQPSAEEAAKLQEEAKAKIIGELTGRYSGMISEEDARELAINPEKILPRIVASAVFDAVQTMQGVVQAQLPNIIAQTTERTAAQRKVAEEFFKDNQDLAKPEYRAALDQAAQMFRQVNPNATREQAIKGVAKLARTALGLEEPPAPGAAPAAATPPAAPPTRPAAYTPVAAGGSSRPAPASRPSSEWDNLIGPDD